MSDPELLAVVRQGERYWFASKQDAHPVVRYLHLNYARQALEMALGGSPRARITRLTGLNIDRRLEQVRRDQHAVAQHLIALSRPGTLP
ncbi:MAG TPA: hypothetical protein VFH61_03635 [Thermoleophilia bacterium]|nr:hypothetical protein [Thermoleophilia bacterium]